jgi:hypothetical protein
MAFIHDTTMSPTKVELLTRWLPKQSWYAGDGTPQLTRVGGFRLDDPEGEVGIEFMLVHDDAGRGGTTYQVPMTYRGSPLPSAEDALIGTGQHGVLGERWIYDGVRDPTLVAELVALLQGRSEPQHQSLSDTPEPRVRVDRTEPSPSGTTETIAGPDGVVIHLVRVLTTTVLAHFEGPDGQGAIVMAETPPEAR